MNLIQLQQYLESLQSADSIIHDILEHVKQINCLVQYARDNNMVIILSQQETIHDICNNRGQLSARKETHE